MNEVRGLTTAATIDLAYFKLGTPPQASRLLQT